MKKSIFKRIAGLFFALSLGLSLVAISTTGSKTSQVKAESITETYTLTGLSSSDSADYTGESKTNSKIVASKGTGSNQPKYYKNGDAVRFYQNNTLIISALNNRIIKSFVFTSSNSTLANFSSEGYQKGTWTGSAESVTLAVSAAARLTKIQVTTEEKPTGPSMLLDKTELEVFVGSDSTFTITTSNLNENFLISGGDDNYFTISYTPSKENGDHIITLHGISSTSDSVILVISSSGASSLQIEINVIIAPTYSTGFESSDGFTDSTTYNNSDPYEEGLSGKMWSIRCGHATSNAAAVKTGTMGLHLRYYTKQELTPYAEMQWDVSDGHEMTFYAKGTASVNLKVEYSIDSGTNWITLLESQSVTSSSFSLVTATIPNYVSKARFKILSLSTTDKSGIYIDDLQITEMAAPTDPSVVITSKDGNGVMSGVLGDLQEVTYETANDSGFTLNWVLVDSDSIVDWEKPYISFEDTGTDATLTAQLLDGSDVVASDTVILHTLTPSIDIKVNGTSRANWNMYEEDEIIIAASYSNKPDSATVALTTNDTDGEYCTFNTIDGSFKATAAGNVVVTATMTYNDKAVATDTLNITITALGEASLVVSTGSGKTTYKFGESLDTTGWTATYIDRKGVSSDVLSSLDFGSLEYIGTKTLNATYNGVESNGVNITVTNNGATVDGGTTSQNLETSTTTTSLGINSEKIKTLNPAISNVTSVKVTFVAAFTGTANTSYTHVVTLKLYDGSDNVLGTQEVTTTAVSSSNGTFEHTFTISPASTVAKASYNLTTKQSGSNLRQRSFDVQLTYGDPTFASKQALAWAQYFVDEIGGLCDVEGNTSSDNVKAIKDKWETLSNEYGWMIGDSKDYFAEHTDNATIARVVGMYSKIVARYGQNNFIVNSSGTAVVNATHVNPLGGVLGENVNAITIIIVVSLVSLTAIGGYFFYRKRKENI